MFPLYQEHLHTLYVKNTLQRSLNLYCTTFVYNRRKQSTTRIASCKSTCNLITTVVYTRKMFNCTGTKLKDWREENRLSSHDQYCLYLVPHGTGYQGGGERIYYHHMISYLYLVPHGTAYLLHSYKGTNLVFYRALSFSSLPVINEKKIKKS